MWYSNPIKKRGFRVFYDYEIADNNKIVENHKWSFDLEKTLDDNR